MTSIFRCNFSSWFSRHKNDEFVKCSRKEGFRARSAFKLLQILENFPRLIDAVKRQNSNMVDLGAAPGSWSQVLASLASPSSKIIAFDLLPIKPLDKVRAIQADFTTLQGKLMLDEVLNSNSAAKTEIDLVVSDLCANLSGNNFVDNQNNLQLWELALDFSKYNIKSNGHFVMKFFESPEAKPFKRTLEITFDQVIVFKPKASRSESSEKYFICLNKLN